MTGLDTLELEAAILPHIEWGSDRTDDSEFGRIAGRLADYQESRIAPYGAYCRHLGYRPGADWREIPPVPTSAFKTHDLSATPPGRESVLFETSGTTISRPGRVRLGRTALYEASLTAGFERHLLPDGAHLPAIVFGPRFEEAPRSSLWFMVDRVVRRLSTGATWIVQGGEPKWPLADDALAQAAARREPVLLLGTTLFFVAYFERPEAERRRVTLPPGSRAMDTGGAKGRRAEFTREEIADRFTRFLGIPRTHLVNEYGMAEMASQFYDDTLVRLFEGRARERGDPEDGKTIPPWVRTRVLDPERMNEVPDGTRGLLVHYDLANLEVPLAIQTEDVGLRVRDLLVVERRLPGAEARGCSLAFERFLEEEERRATREPLDSE
jgi:Acyl-protein synthetase, LuxE